jgi:hypothetical protein
MQVANDELGRRKAPLKDMRRGEAARPGHESSGWEEEIREEHRGDAARVADRDGLAGEDRS